MSTLYMHWLDNFEHQFLSISETFKLTGKQNCSNASPFYNLLRFFICNCILFAVLK